MKLAELIETIPNIEHGGLPDVEITMVTADSRQVLPGALFVAVTGTQEDGHRFLAHAVQQGAAAAVGEQPAEGLPIPYFRVEDARLALAELAAAWHGHPARSLVMIGVTGTDGKSTTCNLIHRILSAGGLRAGMVTTVNAVIGERVLDTGLHVTTPGPMEVQGYLHEMVAAGLTHCVLESTSHGLAQHRVSACDFDLAVITNITHEHLDYHGSWEAYREAKARLFRSLDESAPKAGGPPKTAILNLDDPSYAFLREATSARPVTYGSEPEADVHLESLESGEDGISLRILAGGQSTQVRSGLIGAYNAANILAAFATTVAGLGIDPEAAAEGIAALPTIPGRMERIDLGQHFTAIVDFAHTPNALRRTLETARALSRGRVIAVFGSAGLRDRAKRRMMAEISARLADLTILTAEDPRTEDLEVILSEMAEGARAAGAVEGQQFWRVPDRGEALRKAVSLAREGDWLLACGKGHEQSMCFGETEYAWDDRLALRAALAESLGIQGPEMPLLPTSR